MKTYSAYALAFLSLILLFPSFAHADFGPDLGWMILAALFYPILLLANSLVAKKGARLIWFLITLLLYPLTTFLAARLDLGDYYEGLAIGLSVNAALWIAVFIFILLKKSASPALAFTPLLLAIGILLACFNLIQTGRLMSQGQFAPYMISGLLSFTLTTLASLWWIIRLMSIKDPQQAWLTSESNRTNAILAVAFVVAIKSTASNLYAILLNLTIWFGVDPIYNFYVMQAVGFLVSFIYLAYLLNQAPEQVDEWITEAALFGVIFYAGMSALALIIALTGQHTEIHYWQYLIPSANFLLTMAAAYGLTRWRTLRG